MNRNDFLKKLGFGALAVAITPKVMAIDPTPNDIPNIDDIISSRATLVDVALFLDGKEVSYKKYNRQTVPFRLKFRDNRLIYDMPNVVFPVKGNVTINEVRMFRKDDGCDWGAIYFPQGYSVMNGNFTICWNEYCS